MDFALKQNQNETHKNNQKKAFTPLTQCLVCFFSGSGLFLQQTRGLQTKPGEPSWGLPFGATRDPRHRGISPLIHSRAHHQEAVIREN